MAYYSVLDVIPTNDSWIPGYLPTANERVAAHGGKYIARTTSHEQVEGDKQEAAQAFMSDEAYAPHLAARTASSVSHHYLIEGKDDLA